jgi:hypothetical protein
MPGLPVPRARQVTVTPPPAAPVRLDDELWDPRTDRFIARVGRAVVMIVP